MTDRPLPMPYRTPGELASPPAKPLPPERYKPTRRSAYNAILWGGMLAFYGLIIASTMAGWSIGMWAPLAFVFAVLAWVVRWRTRFVKFFRQWDALLGVLDSGRVDEASAKFDRLIVESRLVPQVQALFIAGRAMAFLKRGEFARARTLLADVEASRWLRPEGFASVRGRTEVARAMIDALSGDLESARTWFAKAKATILPGREGMLLPSECVLGLRAGRFDEVLTRIDADWLDAEGGLTAHDSRVIRVLRAFAIKSRATVDEDELRATIAGTKPFRSGEFDYLGAAWPEMAEFLTTHGLVASERKSVVVKIETRELPPAASS